MKDLELWFDYADAASKGPTVNQIAASILVAIGLCVFATACKKKEDAAPRNPLYGGSGSWTAGWVP